MRPLSRASVFGCAIAVVLTVLIVLVRRSSYGVLLAGNIPLVPFMAVVALAAWSGGMFPGLFATGLGVLAGCFVLFTSPGGQITTPNGRVRLFVFVVVGGLVSWLFEALHAARRQADAAREFQARADEERREAERSLRESSQWLELALEAADLGRWELDLKDRTTRRTLRHDRIFGYDAPLPVWTIESFLGHVLPEDRARVDASMRQTLATGEPWDLECRIRRADGLIRWIWVRGRIDHDDRGRPWRMLGTLADITERRLGEDLRREQNERLNLLWESAGVMLVTDDPDAMLRGLFEKIGRHLGLDCYFCYLVNDAGDALRLESCGGVPEGSVGTFDRLEFGQAICGTVASGRRPIVVNDVQKSSDPKVLLIKGLGIAAYVCNPLLIGDRLLGTLSFGSRTRDRFDAAELEFLETICHYVTVAYERLRLIGQLREADRRKDEFLATLAHELRNPLAPIRNSLEILQLARDDAEFQEQARTTMERQLGQMVRLIDDLLDVSRITRGKLELRRDRIELSAAVELAVEVARPLIEAMGHQLDVALPPEPVLLDADLTRLAQVFSNLLSNAGKYTDRGGRIELNAELDGDEVVMRVTDTGIGIPAEKLPRIFEMFEQVDRSLERTQGGLGIGLTLVKRLVELHGGTIAASSAGPGRGSEFVVRLPVQDGSSPSESSGKPAHGAVPLSKLRLLVVDDNRDSATSLARLLALDGHETDTAFDGLEAMDAAEAIRPDVVLLDLGLPKLNGYDAARRIREHPWGRDMKLVALTGWGQEEDRRRSLEAGFDGHLVKPVDYDALIRLLATLVPATN